MKFLDREINKGEKVKFDFEIIDDYKMPLWVICGTNQGQTLVLTAGVHGCEYVGIQTARQIFEELIPEDLHGNIIILPLINQEGFYAGVKQIFPRDSKNLNREFPANSDSITGKVAAFVEKYIYPQADFLLDLHGGDINEAMTPLVFFPVEAAEEVKEKAARAARHLPIQYRIPSTSKNGLYSWGVQKGLAGVLLEIGGLGRWSEEEVELCKSCVRSILGFMEILPNKGENTAQAESLKTVYAEANHKGFWYPMIQPNEEIEKGQLLGEIRNLDNKVIESHVAAFDGVVLYHTVSLGVREGDALIAYGRIK